MKRDGTQNKRNYRPFVAATMGVATAYVVVLPVAFSFRQKYAWIRDFEFGLAVALAIVFFAVVVTGFLAGPFFAKRSRPIAGNLFRPSAGSSESSLRTAGVYGEYGSQVAWMEAWQAASDAYQADPCATRTCGHLKTVERAMRLAGIETHVAGPSPDSPEIMANCRIHIGGSAGNLIRSNSIQYVERYEPDHFGFDVPYADLRCANCPSKIVTVHPDKAVAGTPNF